MNRLRPHLLGGLILGTVIASGAAALDFELPSGARLTAERITELDGFDLPLGEFDGAKIPMLALEGKVDRRAWRIPTAGLTPLQVMVPLREQIEAAGFDLRFECAAQSCGGFDFRFAVEVLPGPNMYVNISRFRYLSATRGPEAEPGEAIGALVSVTAEAAYVQIIQVDTGINLDDLIPEVEPAPDEIEELPDPVQVPAEVKVVKDRLLDDGFMILSDLEFETGTSGLGAGPYASLERLATLLNERSDLRIVLVGHTDAVGSLAANIELSRDRARSVRSRLIDVYGVSADRLDAEGMGYLAPVASNLTEAGRDQNRRVEAVLLNVTQ